MKFHHFVFVTSLMFFTFTVKGMQYDEEEYVYDEDYHDYEYEEEYVEEEYVEPTFISSPQSLKINVGDPFELPCLIDPSTDVVIVWKMGNNVKAIGEKTIDEEFYVKSANDGNYLANVQSKPNHEGEYTCEIAVGQSTPIILTHTVGIITGLEVEIYTVNEGENATMFCSEPQGMVINDIWLERVGDEMPDVNYSDDPISFTVVSVTRQHAGEYNCKVEDGSGQTQITSRVRLEVNYPPEIEGDDDQVSNTRFGGSKLITCNVTASPNATVTWAKDGKLIEVNPHSYLHLESITKEMLGTYQCRAENGLGEDIKQIKVKGMASEAHVWSNSKSSELTKHTLKWTVNSFSPVSECKLWVKKEGDQDWTEYVTGMVPLINWGKIGSFNGKLDLENLKAGEKYLVKIASSNSFGFNEPNKTFSFRTKATDLSYRSSFKRKVKKIKKKAQQKRKKSSAIIWSSSESKYMTKHFLKWMVNTDSPISTCNVTVKMEDEEDWTVHEVGLKSLLPGSKINSFVGKLSLQRLKPGTKYQFKIITEVSNVEQKDHQVFSFTTKKDPNAVSSKKGFKVKKFVTSVVSKWGKSLNNIIFG